MKQHIDKSLSERSPSYAVPIGIALIICAVGFSVGFSVYWYATMRGNPWRKGPMVVKDGNL